MFLQGISILWCFILVPLFLGILVLGALKIEEVNLAISVVVGYVSMFAVFQVIAIPLIFTRQPFHLLVYVTAAVFLLLNILSLVLYGKKVFGMLKSAVKECLHMPWTIYTAIMAVGVQCYFYFTKMVTNLDDSYYVAAAATSLYYDTMYLRSPYTGRVVDKFNLRYVCSPYPMLQAFWARLTHLSAPVIAHTILPPFLVCVAYLVYYCMGNMLFAQEKTEDGKSSTKKLTGLFITILSWIHITSYYCMRNQGSVLLVRIWQGKATLAAVVLPFVFYWCYKMVREPENKGNYGILLITALASCLVSSMGVALTPVMIGIFALLFGVMQKKFGYTIRMILCCSPCIIVGILYLVLKATAD